MPDEHVRVDEPPLVLLVPPLPVPEEPPLRVRHEGGPRTLRDRLGVLLGYPLPFQTEEGVADSSGLLPLYGELPCRLPEVGLRALGVEGRDTLVAAVKDETVEE